MSSGLAAGLVEGMLSLGMQQLALYGGPAPAIDVTAEILWIAPVVNMVLFALSGCVLVAAAAIWPGLPLVMTSVLVFSFLAVAQWIAVVLHPRMHPIAVVLLAAGLAVHFVRIGRRRAGFQRVVTSGRPLGILLVATASVAGSVEIGAWLRDRAAIRGLPAAARGSPNVLVLVADTLRADHLSGYGYRRPTSPNIDRLGREGVLFEHAFATSSWTAPSHASLLTGRFPHEHGVEWQTVRALLRSSHVTLPEFFRARGYVTGAFSANVFWFTRAKGFGRGFIRFEDYFGSLADAITRTVYGAAIEMIVLRRLGWRDIPGRKRASDINRSLFQWIDAHRGAPFFAMVNYMDTHDPYTPPEPYRGRFSSHPRPGGVLNWRIGHKAVSLTTAELRSEVDAYDGAISYLDHHVGELLGQLRARALHGDTVVVLTSDHGEAFGEHGTFLHANSLYLEEIRVPLVIAWPGRVPAGVRVAAPVTNAALPATLTSLLGHEGVFPGVSLSELWRLPDGANTSDAMPVLSEMASQPWAHPSTPVHSGDLRSLVTTDWHYIEHSVHGGEVFAWQRDPLERVNLHSSTPPAPDLVRLRCRSTPCN